MSTTLHAVAERPDDAPEPLYLAEEPFLPAGLIVTALGELDVYTAGELRARLSAAVDSGVSRVVLDLRGVSFMDSVALAAIVRAQRQLGDQGRMALVTDPDSYGMLILRAAGLPRSLELHALREDALDSLGAPAAAA
jgi:anti-anti-sigma factor